MNLGDFAPGVTISDMFTSIDADGAPIVLTGSPAIAVYKDVSDTQSTAGATISASVDSVVGLNRIAIDTSADGTFYAAGSSFRVVLTAGTVDGVSVVGYVLAKFTLGRSSAYARLGAPAGASVSADIAAIEDQTDELAAFLADVGSNGAGLTALPWNPAWDAEVQSEVQDAIEANHLDHLLAQTYDPASKPGAADALLNELVENDGGVARFTANALEQGPGGSLVLRTATAQAGGASTITLDASASASDDAYRLATVSITSGTGAGQSRQVSAYVGATKVATVLEAWDIVPDNTSVFILSPFGVSSVTVAALVAANWAALRSENNVAGSFGEYMNADVVRISGDAGAADNLEAMVDGTGLTLTNVTVPELETILATISDVTDQFSFTSPGLVDANSHELNSEPVTGGGATPWGRT